MLKKLSTYLAVTAITATIGCGSASAADKDVVDISSQWDSAVSSLLLAAGMYGLDIQSSQDNTFAHNTSVSLFKTLPRDLDMLDSQNITLSYTGSSGRLDFSAGYIYTSMPDNKATGTLLVGLDPHGQEGIGLNPVKRDNAWYMALDYSKTFHVNDNILMGFGSKAMLMKNPFEEHDGRIISMLLNLPMSYKNYFTLTPELQWSHTLPGGVQGHMYAKPELPDNKDVFYGGMSISFSY